jgi:hypothetical protein
VTQRRVADWWLVSVALLLSVYGIAMVYSAGQTDVPSPYVSGAWKRQLFWFFLALPAAWAVTRASLRFMEWLAWPAYLFGLVLLVVTLVFGSGAGTAASVKGWLTIGGVRLGQPAELAKPLTVLMLARVLTMRREAPKSLVDLWKPLLVVGVPWLLIMAQPDLGSGLAFVGILFAMLFWAGIPWPMLVLLASPAVSLVLSFSAGLWGAWFVMLGPARVLLQAVPRRGRRPDGGERDDGRGGAADLGQAQAVPAEAPARLPRPAERPEGVGLPRAPVAGRHRLRGRVRQGVDAGDPEAPRVPSCAAHRLHLGGGRRGAGLHRRVRRARPLPLAAHAVHAHRGAGHRLVRVARRLRAHGELVRARDRERRDDAQPHADHRDPAAVLQLRRVVHAHLLARRGPPGAHLGGGARPAEGLAV